MSTKISFIKILNILIYFFPFLQKADLAICDLTITSERQSAVDFTVPFLNLGELLTLISYSGRSRHSFFVNFWNFRNILKTVEDKAHRRARDVTSLRWNAGGTLPSLTT